MGNCCDLNRLVVHGREKEREGDRGTERGRERKRDRDTECGGGEVIHRERGEGER